MNILIVSYESWRDTNNGGNVLSNIFCAFPDAQIAQIYCSGELPQNSICQNYFQISDSMLLTSQKGRVLEKRSYAAEADTQENVIENKLKSRIPSFLTNFSRLARELLWVLFDWKTTELENYIKEFKPDVIFAPCYSFFHVSKVALYVQQIAQCPMISYISDDNYSLKRVSFSPSFFVNRLITRKWIRRHFANSSLIYTMTELQKEEYEAKFKRPMKILCKSAVFSEREKETGDPIRILYAGGLYLNRWKVLAELSKVLNDINKDGIKAQLHIFSGSKLNKHQERKLNDRRNSFLHGQVSYDDLMSEYQRSDIAVHVESFDIKNSLITRLSFSTKIIDCLSSGCAVLAIGPGTQAGISYLKDNDGAVCVNSIKDLQSTVEKIISCPDIISEYSKKASQLGKKNHLKENIEASVREDFYGIISGSQLQG